MNLFELLSQYEYCFIGTANLFEDYYFIKVIRIRSRLNSFFLRSIKLIYWQLVPEHLKRSYNHLRNVNSSFIRIRTSAQKYCQKLQPTVKYSAYISQNASQYKYTQLQNWIFFQSKSPLIVSRPVVKKFLGPKKSEENYLNKYLHKSLNFGKHKILEAVEMLNAQNARQLKRRYIHVYRA